MLAEAARVLAPGGTLFVYTHVRKNARIAAGLRWINGLARVLERRGLIDMRQGRLRKSDPLTPPRVVGGCLENIMMRRGGGARARRAARRLSAAGTPDADSAAIREARTAA